MRVARDFCLEDVADLIDRDHLPLQISGLTAADRPETLARSCFVRREKTALNRFRETIDPSGEIGPEKRGGVEFDIFARPIEAEQAIKRSLDALEIGTERHRKEVLNERLGIVQRRMRKIAYQRRRNAKNAANILEAHPLRFDEFGILRRNRKRLKLETRAENWDSALSHAFRLFLKSGAKLRELILIQNRIGRNDPARAVHI